MDNQFEAQYFSELVNELKEKFFQRYFPNNIQNLYNIKIPNIMETQEFDQTQYLKAQLRYGFRRRRKAQKIWKKALILKSSSLR